MRILVLALALISPFFGIAQDYQQTNEDILFEFVTTEDKKLVIAMDQEQEYLVFRYGTMDNIELEYPASLENSWKSFNYSWYMRGGGIQNLGMDINYLFFTHENQTYVVFQEYYAQSQETSYGLKIVDPEMEERQVFEAIPSSVNGSLTVFRNYDQITISEQTFE